MGITDFERVFLRGGMTAGEEAGPAEPCADLSYVAVNSVNFVSKIA